MGHGSPVINIGLSKSTKKKGETTLVKPMFRPFMGVRTPFILNCMVEGTVLPVFFGKVGGSWGDGSAELKNNEQWNSH